MNYYKIPAEQLEQNLNDVLKMTGDTFSQHDAKLPVRRSVDCPMCLFSSGIVADGKGTKCSTCGGVGTISKAKYNKLVDELGDIVGTRCA